MANFLTILRNALSYLNEQEMNIMKNTIRIFNRILADIPCRIEKQLFNKSYRINNFKSVDHNECEINGL